MDEIELRWLRKPGAPYVYEGVDGTMRNGITAGETVLQYRVKRMTMGYGYQAVGGPADSVQLVAHERPMGWSWSEWQDVPSIDQSDSAHE